MRFRPTGPGFLSLPRQNSFIYRDGSARTKHTTSGITTSTEELTCAKTDLKNCGFREIAEFRSFLVASCEFAKHTDDEGQAAMRAAEDIIIYERRRRRVEERRVAPHPCHTHRPTARARIPAIPVSLCRLPVAARLLRRHPRPRRRHDGTSEAARARVRLARGRAPRLGSQRTSGAAAGTAGD